MSSTAKTFDRLARPYRALEALAFGGDLARARLAGIGSLAGLGEILILGDGDGRFAEALARRSTESRLTCLDISAGMQALAKARLASVPRPQRITFILADALEADLGTARYDAVTSLFFLDCFTQAQTEALVPRIARALRPASLWLHADFEVPGRGLARLRAQAWVGLLYLFFRWQAGIRATALPEVRAPLARSGFLPEASQAFQAGLLRSTVYRRTADRAVH